MKNTYEAMEELEHATRFVFPRTATLERNIAELLRRSSGSSCATSCATCGVASARRMAARCSVSVPVRQARMTWIHGQYAGVPLPSQHRPQATRTPSANAKRPNSSASLVLPIPGSPLSRNRWL
jgi:hypothetical protein